MKLKLIISIFICFLFWGCNKRVTTNIPSAILLTNIRVVQNATGNYSGFDFTYDGNNRLIKCLHDSLFTYGSFADTCAITRNASGIINLLTGNGGSFYVVSTDASARYVSRVGNLAGDSICFSYSGNNITQIQYHLGSNNVLVTFSLTYDVNGNITVLQYLAGSYSETYTFVYDNMVNPLRLNTEAVLLDLYPVWHNNISLVGGNNIIKATYQDSSSPNIWVTNYVYTYNSNNMPLSAIGTQTPGRQTSTITYTYQ